MNYDNPEKITKEEEEEIAFLSKLGKFDEVAILLTNIIMVIIPFNTKEDLNTVLMGRYDWTNSELNKHTGFLGWYLYIIGSTYSEVTKSQYELRELMKNEKIKNFIKDIYNKSQKYLIQPMINKILNIAKSKDIHKYQAVINCILKMDKIDSLDGSNKNCRWITSELINMMIDQGLIIKKETGVRKNKYVLPGPNYGLKFNPGSFVVPLCKYSKLHQRCRKILEKYIKTHKLDVVIKDEYKIPDKLGYPGYMRIDIALFKDNILICCIEADGEQHDIHVPHFHRNGKTLEEQQERDRAKDRWILNKCNNECIRIKTIKEDGSKYISDEQSEILTNRLDNIFQM